MPIASGVGADERFAPLGVRQPCRGSRRDCRAEASLGQPSHPVAEHAGRERRLGDDHARLLGRRGELRVTDRGQRQIANRPAPVPALEAGGRLDAFQPRPGIEVGQRREPLDAGEAVTVLAAPLGVR